MLAWKRWSFIMIRNEEKPLVLQLVRLLRSRGWFPVYLRRLLADSAAGRAPSPLAAVIDAKRLEAGVLGYEGDG